MGREEHLAARDQALTAERREILDQIGAMLREHLAADAWGRVLVEVVRGPGGELLVAGVDVEEVIDEGRVDAAFGGGDARALMPVVAKATEALCAIEGVEVEDVRGGTFVRLGDRIEWLPGLVRAPSVAFDRERDALAAKLRAKNERLALRGALSADFEHETIAFEGATARATLVGTFARTPRTWAWGGSNPRVPEAVRRASAALVDAIEDRSLWEISTPVFATDEPTAWALAALVCDRAGGDGVHAAAREDGVVFVLLRDVQRL